MPFFTVIVPLFNKEKYIEHAIQSILNQTFLDYEVLIINDGSTDESLSRIEPFLSNKIQLIEHENNKGLSAARNTGIKNAKADYVAYLDADDYWKPTFLETIHQLILNFPQAKIFGTNYEECYGKKILKPENGSEHLAADFDGIIPFFKINLKQGIYNHGSVCFHKSVFEKAGFYNENLQFSEDLDFNIRANYHFELAYSNSVQMQYTMISDNQLTRTSLKNKQIPNFDVYEEWAKNNSDLKKYLDFERYVLGKRLKISGDERWKKTIAKIDKKNLNFKQNLLLKLPKWILILIKKIKIYLIKKGMKFTTYSNIE